ncbi:MAG TPA: hypothetical protein VF998_09860 [Candidatus Limnocylindria bacterium]
MMDKTEREENEERERRSKKVDDDPHADHSLDPDEHYGQESDIPREDDVKRR